MKVISGGQTGADRAGLDAAAALGLPTGGHAPAGIWTESGADPSLERLGLAAGCLSRAGRVRARAGADGPQRRGRSGVAVTRNLPTGPGAADHGARLSG